MSKTKKAMGSGGFKKAAREYRALVRIQNELPEEKRWTMGAAIRTAKARAYVELEAAS